MATIHPTRPVYICITVGAKIQVIKPHEIPNIVSKLRESDKDVDIGKVIISRDVLKEVADELERWIAELNNQYF